MDCRNLTNKHFQPSIVKQKYSIELHDKFKGENVKGGFIKSSKGQVDIIKVSKQRSIKPPWFGCLQAIL